MLQPEPLARGRLQELLPVPADRHLLGQHQVQQGDQAEPEGHLQVRTDHRQPGGAAGVALAEHHQALATGLPGKTFELQDRQVEAAGGAEAAPGEAGDQLRLEQARVGAQGFLEAGRVAEQGAGEDVQRQPLVGRLQQPEQEHGEARVVPAEQGEQAEDRQGDQRPAAHQQAGMAPGEQHAQVHGLPGAARADGDAGISQAHAASCPPGRSRAPPAARGRRPPGTSPGVSPG
ncbi:hypothetical protein D3C76_1209460 [compost metagenome]